MSNKSNKKAYAPIKVSKLGSLTDLTQANNRGAYTDNGMMMVGMGNGGGGGGMNDDDD